MAPIIPFLPLIATGLGLVGGAVEQNQQNQRAKGLMNQQKQLAGPVAAQGQNLYNQGQQAIGPTLGYYSNMLANPREATAPEQNRINTLYAGQASNVRNQYPRGGYGPSAAEGMRTQQRAATEGVIQQGRPMAAQGLGNMGLNLSQLGLQGQGMGAGILGNVFNQGMSLRQQQYGEMAGAGNALFGAYQQYLLGQAMKTPGGSPGGNGSFNFSNYLNTSPGGSTPGSSTPPTNWTGMAGSGLYGGSTPNSGPSGNP